MGKYPAAITEKENARLKYPFLLTEQYQAVRRFPDGPAVLICGDPKKIAERNIRKNVCFSQKLARERIRQKTGAKKAARLTTDDWRRGSYKDNFSSPLE